MYCLKESLPFHMTKLSSIQRFLEGLKEFFNFFLSVSTIVILNNLSPAVWARLFLKYIPFWVTTKVCPDKIIYQIFVWKKWIICPILIILLFIYLFNLFYINLFNIIFLYIYFIFSYFYFHLIFF